MRIYLATSNRHKVAEARYILGMYSIEVVQKNVEKLEVQADEVEVVAEAAARRLCEEGEELVAVEDAGLYIDALNGFPGPYSEYVYRTLGIAGVLKLMAGVERRSARFKSAVAICVDKSVEVFTGVAEGSIAAEPRGSGGFGFDPIFVPAGHLKTFAEMSLEEKSALSHRGKAFRRLAEWLISRGPRPLEAGRPPSGRRP
ncbi:MAG: XTP/dITP diphosphatase [Thermoproteus sp.]|nr:XTP/dITP diphosphatase [Thermoproteus sp.]